MSEFLVVIPEGWVEVPFSWVENRMGWESCQQAASQELWAEFTNSLEESGNLKPEQEVLAVKLFTDDSGPRIWMQFNFN